jgi:quinol monooxygenase YgiN
MILLRIKVRCLPDRMQQALAVFTAVIEPSRELEGVIRFDVGRDLADPDAIVALELFEDEAARERQESLPQVATLWRLLPEIAAEPPELTLFEIASAVPAL